MNETSDTSKIHDQQEKIVEKCPICLQKFNPKSKSYSSKCFHSFCFECLLEWTKIKDSCPLCKQKFDRIIYDVKSNLEFKEYYIEKEDENTVQNQPPVQIIAYTLPSSASGQSQTSQNINLNIHLETASRTIITRSRASWELNKEQAPTEFRVLVYLKGWYVNSLQTQYNFKVSNIDLEFNDNNDAKLNNNTTSNSDFMSCIGYKMVQKFRITQPEWYKKNPACTHRLINFINRELKSLEYILPQNSTYRFRHYLTDNILNLLKTHPIESDEFINGLKNYIKPSKYARHFRHELSAFTRSTCHDLIEYDAKCVYYTNLTQMPIELKLMNQETENIIPFNAIPVSLIKYKLILDQNSHETDKIHQIIRYENIDQFLNNNVHRNDSNFDESESDSDQSSFCEIITPPRKPSPIEITIEDDLDENTSSVCSSLSTNESLPGNGENDESIKHVLHKQKSRSRSRSISTCRKRSASRSTSRSKSKSRSHKKKKKYSSSSSKKKSSKHHHKSHKKKKSSSSKSFRKYDEHPRASRKSRSRSLESNKYEYEMDLIKHVDDTRVIIDKSPQNTNDKRIVLADNDVDSPSKTSRKHRKNSSRHNRSKTRNRSESLGSNYHHKKSKKKKKSSSRHKKHKEKE